MKTLIQILTAFPGIFDSVFSHSIIKRAVQFGALAIEVVDLRRFARDKHNRLDDTQYGGGPGMVMKPEPLFRAVEFLKTGLGTAPKVVLMSAGGATFDQAKADSLAKERHLIIVCGRYKGVDQRFIDACVDEEISIGDYVLSGGEIPAMAVVDSVARLLPGVLGDRDSALTDSFREGLLEGPLYTRPVEYRGLKTPEVLLSGNHRLIEEWRAERALEKTQCLRPELLKRENQEKS